MKKQELCHSCKHLEIKTVGVYEILPYCNSLKDWLNGTHYEPEKHKKCPGKLSQLEFDIKLLDEAINHFLKSNWPVFILSEREREILKLGNGAGKLTERTKMVFEQIDWPRGLELKTGIYYFLNPNLINDLQFKLNMYRKRCSDLEDELNRLQK